MHILQGVWHLCQWITVVIITIIGKTALICAVAFLRRFCQIYLYLVSQVV
jgi:hypothetical protein